MTLQLTEFETKNVDEYGIYFTVKGTWNGKRFDITLFCEYEGRDLDAEINDDSLPYNPMEDIDFFCTLSEEQKYKNMYKAGYKTWKKLVAS